MGFMRCNCLKNRDQFCKTTEFIRIETQMPQYHNDYEAFKEDMTARRYSGEVPEIEISNQWICYICHHPVGFD